MTDWDRVERLRSKGSSWEEIAEDPKVGFQAPQGAAPGRALKTLYFTRRSRVRRGKSSDRSKRRDVSESEPTGIRGSRRGVWVVLGVVILLVGGFTAYLIVYHPASPSTNVVTYCGVEQFFAHYHVLLVINDNGSQQPLPYDRTQTAEIGYIDSPGFTNSAYYCPNAEIHVLHTHDGSGILHCELPPSIVNAGITPSLGDFFTIWGEPLSATQVWTFSGHVSASVYDYGTHATTSYPDPTKIPLPLTTAAFPIPQALIFNGQYGSGASGGSFSGEVVYLNVSGSVRAFMAVPPSSGLDGGGSDHEAVPDPSHRAMVWEPGANVGSASALRMASFRIFAGNGTLL